MLGSVKAIQQAPVSLQYSEHHFTIQKQIDLIDWAALFICLLELCNGDRSVVMSVMNV